MNPVFENNATSETWHRRMPTFFPFVEWPFKERDMSGQINEDPARGAISYHPSNNPMQDGPADSCGPETP